MEGHRAIPNNEHIVLNNLLFEPRHSRLINVYNELLKRPLVYFKG
jgi:hypothetical protein